MNTENEEWRGNSFNEENANEGRDGNRFYSRDGAYARSSYNREGGEQRSYRPRLNP